MKVVIDLQKVSEKYERPHKSRFKLWAEIVCAYLAEHNPEALGGRESLTVCVRLVEPEESLQINSRFKHENKAATVLAFANLAVASESEEEEAVEVPDLLGDLVMCGAKVLEQANEWRVDAKNHWTHLYVHGLLHLFGLEHGEAMEQAESAILTRIGIPDPYASSAT